MRALAVIGFMMAFAGPGLGAAEPLRIELNAMVAAQTGCRLSFVIENKSAEGLTSLKLDLVIFSKDGAIDRRLLVEVGPLHAVKTVVKSFDVDSACRPISAVLVNDVTACVPDSAPVCLDRLVLSSRVTGIRLFK
jgi:hypothetical protein